MGSLISTIVVGLISGALAKYIMPGDDPGGIIVTIILGIAGAFVGSFVGQILGFSAVAGSFTIMGIVLAVVGALILLYLYRLIMNARSKA
ncbi:MAG: GlsB/YeaQ/YmgE family stress response membrane protein [Chloroflexota bacterium]